ncbi:MAG: Asp-tRNA(Asn)/Glu-tRNA(Gln) amidotransferase subunit GatC [Myxococcales bacterium]|nr:Asp-tRNA(Asn)/Glu-tRNA(Gln) amidotransferase subunit GatC [Polyangiaceae bacterium]MDW8247908.1 Asp-tRNA(Asn)/Glu-tRNA(Gln) amidotransferase subunit GatC [Myxococcales bacterium]
MSHKQLPTETVATLLRLARLSATPEEQQKLSADLGKIIEYIQALQEVNTDGIEPTAHVLLDRLAWRDDILEQGLDRSEALAQAPRHDDEGFRVPTFVED